mgnify:CR=1 FL=1
MKGTKEKMLKANGRSLGYKLRREDRNLPFFVKTPDETIRYGYGADGNMLVRWYPRRSSYFPGRKKASVVRQFQNKNFKFDLSISFQK